MRVTYSLTISSAPQIYIFDLSQVDIYPLVVQRPQYAAQDSKLIHSVLVILETLRPDDPSNLPYFTLSSTFEANALTIDPTLAQP